MSEKRDKALREGRRAAMILEDPLTNEIIDAMKADALRALLSCPTDKLIEARAKVNAVDALKENIELYRRKANNAALEIELEEKAEKDG